MTRDWSKIGFSKKALGIDQAHLQELYDAGNTISAISKLTSLGYGTMARLLNHYGISKGHRKHPLYKKCGTPVGHKRSEQENNKNRMSHLGKPCSDFHRQRMREGIRTKRPRGEKHPLWKGNKPARRRDTSRLEYLEWKKSVRERDHYICQRCGFRNEKNPVHHIKSYALYPELRLVVDNGLTLCNPCHYEEHGKERRARSNG